MIVFQPLKGLIMDQIYTDMRRIMTFLNVVTFAKAFGLSGISLQKFRSGTTKSMQYQNTIKVIVGLKKIRDMINNLIKDLEALMENKEVKND